MPQKLTAEAKRVRELLRLLFGGNQSKMAQMLDVPQPIVSRVVNGKLQPGKRLLTALAEHPKVNPGWLATGNGDPLLAAESSTSDGWPIPIAAQLLPGSPTENRGMLTTRTHYGPGLQRGALFGLRTRRLD